MATLREIRKKLNSIQNVRKITQAMEMVAGARLKRVQAKCENARPYMQELKLILNNLLSSSDDLSHPLITGRKNIKRVGLVIVGADKGLCGAYNNNVIAAAEKFLKEQKQVDLYLVGHKICTHFGNGVKRTLVDWGDNITFEVANSIAQDLMTSFLKEEVDEVWIIYTHFINIMTRKVMVERLLPIEIPAPTEESFSTSYIFEPDEQQIFGAILPRFCASKLQLVLHEAFTSELASRILAMQAATKNADDLALELTLERNKLRQSGITRELIEITSGAEASKSLF